MVHGLKALPECFTAVQSMNKNFEVRKNDRPFDIGDIVALNEWTPEDGYSGRCMLLEITYILDNPEYCKEEYVILGLFPLSINGMESEKNSEFDGVAVYTGKGE